MTSLEELFCQIDDFCQSFEPRWQATLLGNGLKPRQRRRALSLSEIMTILVSFHRQSYRNFKHFYQKHVCLYWRQAFPGLPSYQRFVDWMPSSLMPLCLYLKECFGQCRGISFINSTSLKVCHLTPGNTDDRKPVPDLLKPCFGKVFADRGYVSKKLAQQLLEDFDITFFAKPKRNMKN
jgi:hypothetical protein